MAAECLVLGVLSCGGQAPAAPFTIRAIQAVSETRAPCLLCQQKKISTSSTTLRLSACKELSVALHRFLVAERSCLFCKGDKALTPHSPLSTEKKPISMGRLFGVNATFPCFSANGDASCQRVSPVPAFRWRLIVSRTDRGVAPLAMPSRASRLRPTWHLSCGRRFFALAFSDLGIADSGRLLVWLCSTFAVITGASALSASLAIH